MKTWERQPAVGRFRGCKTHRFHWGFWGWTMPVLLSKERKGRRTAWVCVRCREGAKKAGKWAGPSWGGAGLSHALKEADKLVGRRGPQALHTLHTRSSHRRGKDDGEGQLAGFSTGGPTSPPSACPSEGPSGKVWHQRRQCSVTSAHVCPAEPPSALQGFPMNSSVKL